MKMQCKTMISRVSLGVFGVALMFLAGCSPDYSYLETTQATEPPAPASFQRGSFSVSHGTIVLINAIPYSENNKRLKLDDNEELRLQSGDPMILDVKRGTGPNEFVFSGRRVGNTTVLVKIDDDVMEQIPITVVSQ
jgi:hypothetical protein